MVEQTSDDTPACGTVLLLNGSSSSGKTTLSRALQQHIEHPLQHLALDQFRDGLPDRFRGLNSPPGTAGARGLNVVPRAVGDELLTHIEFGEVGERVLRAMRRSVAALAREGIWVVVDDLLFQPGYLLDYVRVLVGVPTYLIGVRCPLPVVEARESERPGRFPGTAKSHYDSVHRAVFDLEVTYDVEVDTSVDTPDACARSVLQRLTAPPRALGRLMERAVATTASGPL
ncbi:MAG: AAA family ATPase [Pseudomonadota bacterium]